MTRSRGLMLDQCCWRPAGRSPPGVFVQWAASSLCMMPWWEGAVLGQLSEAPDSQDTISVVATTAPFFPRSQVPAPCLSLL